MTLAMLLVAPMSLQLLLEQVTLLPAACSSPLHKGTFIMINATASIPLMSALSPREQTTVSLEECARHWRVWCCI